MSAPMGLPKPPPPIPSKPKENTALGLIGFCVAAVPILIFIFAQIIGNLTACHDGVGRVFVCANDVATWARFISGISFFGAFVIVPIGFVLAIIASITKQGRAWGLATLVLCVLPIFFVSL